MSFVLTKRPPAWSLPSSSAADIAVELLLACTLLPYVTRHSPYVHTPLPQLFVPQLSRTSAEPIELITEYCDLDEHRTAHDRALCQQLAHNVRRVELLFVAAAFLQHDRFHKARQEWIGCHMPWPLPWLMRSSIEKRALRCVAEWLGSDAEKVQQARREITESLLAFQELLESSTFPFLFAAQPSTLDVRLAALVAWLAKVPELSANEEQREEERHAAAMRRNEQLTRQETFSDMLGQRFAVLLAHAEHTFTMMPDFDFTYTSRQGSVPAALDQARHKLQQRLRMVGRPATHSSLNLSPSPQTIIAQYNLESDISKLIAERRARWTEPAPTQKELVFVPLPDRIGDQWLQLNPLTDEEKAVQHQRRTRTMILVGIAAAVGAAVYRRQMLGTM